MIISQTVEFRNAKSAVVYQYPSAETGIQSLEMNIQNIETNIQRLETDIQAQK